MTAYRVTIIHDACTTHDVEAESEIDAVDAAMSECGVSLCHQCSNQIELGDPIRAAAVENLETGDTNDEIDPDFEVVRLRARVAELEADAHELLRLTESDSATEWNVAFRKLAASSGYVAPPQEQTP